MAHRVLGIDLGSHSVKVAELQVGFRQSILTRFESVRVEQRSADPLKASFGALKEILSGTGHIRLGPTDIVCVSLPGDRILMRHYTLPFTDPRKVTTVLGGQLADDIPWEIDEVVFDHELLIQGKQGRVAVIVGRSDEVGRYIAEFADLGIEPRQLNASPFVYGALVSRTVQESSTWVIDMGHTRTNVVLIEGGRGVSARTLSFGGHHLTEAIRRKLQLSYEEAERLKESFGLVSPSADKTGRAVSDSLNKVLKPFIGQLEQTIMTLEAQEQQVSESIALCGGGSLLKGLDTVLQQTFSRAVRPLELAADSQLKHGEMSKSAERLSAVAIGVAIEQGRSSSPNLRRGMFAFKTSTSVLRERSLLLATSVLFVFICAAISAYAALYVEKKEHQQLQKELTRISRTVFGKELKSAKLVLNELKKADKGLSDSIPEKSATDLLHALSMRLPARDSAKVDVTRLTIRPGKIDMAGTADSGSTVGKIAASYREEPCFNEVSTGRISDVADGTKQFTLTVKTDCL